MPTARPHATAKVAAGAFALEGRRPPGGWLQATTQDKRKEPYHSIELGIAGGKSIELAAAAAAAAVGISCGAPLQIVTLLRA